MVKVSIKDIAKLSGVSAATVSRTLSNPGLVSKSTRKKVMKAVDETGYKPNRFGASLRTQKSKNVVVVMPDITNQVNAAIIRAIENEATKAGYSVLLGDTQNNIERDSYYGDMVTSGQADGILVFTPRIPFTINKDKPLKDQLPPMVNSCEEIDSEYVHKVVIDNQLGAVKAMQHLLELGHKKIAAVKGPSMTPSTKARLDGYKQALIEAGIEVDTRFIITGDYGPESGYQAMEKLLRLKTRPSAVFCFSDDMAIGAMNALREYDYDIPSDMSVIGFDDITYASLMSPKLTTIRQPLDEMGTQCMQVLLKLMSGNKDVEKYIELPTELIVRQSTGPLSKS